MITDRYSGLVVPVRDAPGLAEAIEYLLEDRDRARLFGRRPREFVEEHMSAEVRIRAVEDIYYRAIRSEA